MIKLSSNYQIDLDLMKTDLDFMKMIKLTWGAAKAEATRERITKGVIL